MRQRRVDTKNSVIFAVTMAVAVIAAMIYVAVSVSLSSEGSTRVSVEISACENAKEYLISQGFNVFESEYSSGGFGTWSVTSTTIEGLASVAKDNGISTIFFNKAIGELVVKFFYFEDGAATYKSKC